MGLQQRIDTLDAAKSGFDLEMEELYMLLFTNFVPEFKKGITDNLVLAEKTYDTLKSMEMTILSGL